MITRMKANWIDSENLSSARLETKVADTDAMDVRVKTNRNSILSSKTLFLSPSTGQTRT